MDDSAPKEIYLSKIYHLLREVKHCTKLMEIQLWIEQFLSIVYIPPEEKEMLQLKKAFKEYKRIRMKMAKKSLATIYDFTARQYFSEQK